VILQRFLDPFDEDRGLTMDSVRTVQRKTVIASGMIKISPRDLVFLKESSEDVQIALIAKRSLPNGDQKRLLGHISRMLLFSTPLKRNFKIL
jgi:hypothetical protein